MSDEPPLLISRRTLVVGVAGTALGAVGLATLLPGDFDMPHPGANALAETPTIAVDNTSVVSAWSTVTVGYFVLGNAPPGSFVRLRDEDAGFAIVEG